MNGLYTLILLILSNIFMTFAWYGHLRLQASGISKNWPLLVVVLFSWGIALFEYLCQVPANIQEVVSLLVFTVVASMMFRGEALHWNHFVAFLFLVLAVYFVFLK